MIDYQEENKVFQIRTKKSIYAFRIDEEGIPVHLCWRPLPECEESELLQSADMTDREYQSSHIFWGIKEVRPYELACYGDSVNCEVSLKAEFNNVAESINQPTRDIRLRYVRHEIVTDAVPGLAPVHGCAPNTTTQRQSLCLTLLDILFPFAVKLFYRVTPELDIIERWIELENRGTSTIKIDTCSFATLNIPASHIELTNVDGFWFREGNIRRRLLPVGITSLEHRGLQTGHNHNPFFMLNQPEQAIEEHGQVYFGQLAYSGNWRIAIERHTTRAVSVHGGYNPFDFEINLDPGAIHTTPQFICGTCDEGYGGASRRLHRYIRNYILPGYDGPRPVLYNSWEATEFRISSDQQIELAEKAAAIGVELFCLDDGWFGGRRNDKAGLGDWYVSPEVFPDGLEALVDKVHNLGMLFGLWVEPEMVNPDSDLYREHPEWVLHYPGRPRTEFRNQLILDFGRAEVVEYILTILDDLVTSYKIDFFKWDMNRNAAEAGSPAGKEIWFRHVEAVYSIMDRLRKNHPKLSIQSCSGGGGRIDAGILGRVDQVWTSDRTEPFDRIGIQEGYSLSYPARCMEAWVTGSSVGSFPEEQLLKFNICMRGNLGIGTNLNELDAEALAGYKEQIAFFKKIRPVIHNGDLYRLERLSDNLQDDRRSIIQYVSQNREESVYSLAVRDSQSGPIRMCQTTPPPLKSLISSKMYAVEDYTGQILYKLSGLDLMTRGIPGDIEAQRGHSRTLYLY